MNSLTDPIIPRSLWDCLPFGWQSGIVFVASFIVGFIVGRVLRAVKEGR